MQETLKKYNNNSVISILDDFLLQDVKLNLFQKILLATNGTVTDLLKLYSGKNIHVQIVNQELTKSGEKELFLCPDNSNILKRQILLCSESINYIYADSIFLAENLSQSAQYKLLQTDKPIGLIWKDEKIETYKEIVEYKLESCGSLAKYFNVQPETQMISRIYLIYSQGTILGMISEKFPITHFREV